MRKLKRNDIVMEKDHKGAPWSPYGRVWRRIDDSRVQVIFCTKDIPVVCDDELVHVTNYKGRWDRYGPYYIDPDTKEEWRMEKWIPMASLRRLKQMAQIYNDVWRKPKKRRGYRAIERGPNGVWIYKD